MIRSVFLLGLALALAGCGREEQKPVPGGINISAPGGVGVTIDEQGNTSVRAPGVKVDANAKGANVSAPGVEVKAKN